MKFLPSEGLASRESTLDRKRFHRSEKSKKDLQQTVFFATKHEVTFTGNPNKYATITEKGLDPCQDITCIFCLSITKLQQWLISTKKGYNRSNGKCPVCGNGSRFKSGVWLQSLLKDPHGAEKYAEFVYNYRLNGFWQKHEKNHEQWKTHLKMAGWTQNFWNEYKRLRGDLQEEEDKQRAEASYKEYEQSQEENN